MTNFEKWKEILNVKKILEIFKEAGCYKCPALKVCRETEGCENAFLKWAEAEVKNDYIGT
jgi:hypothetical protein